MLFKLDWQWSSAIASRDVVQLALGDGIFGGSGVQPQYDTTANWESAEISTLNLLG